MNSSKSRWLHVTVCAVLGVALAACQRTPDVVKIGVGQPLSGPLQKLGEDMVNGARLAVDEINAQGGVLIDGSRVRLELVTADDRADALAGVEAARNLVDAGALVALAHLNSGVSIEAAPVYAMADVPQLAISTKPSYTELNLLTTLRLVANDKLQARAMGQYAAELAGAERFAVIDDNTPYGKGLADDAAAAIGGQGRTIALRLSLDNKTTEFSGLVAELGRTSTDVIVTTLADFQVGALIRQLDKAGLASQMRILGGDTIKTDKLPQSAIPIKAVYATSSIVEAKEFPGGKVFLEKFRAKYNAEPVYGAHYAYDAVYLVADAMARNASIDKKALVNTLKSFDGNCPMTNSMRFGADGEQRYGAVAVYQIRGGAWEPLMRSDRW